MKNLGADEIVDYRQTEEDQLQAIKGTTGGNFCRVFDSVAKSAPFALRTLNEASAAKEKYFSTTNDWYFRYHTVNSMSIANDLVGRKYLRKQ